MSVEISPVDAPPTAAQIPPQLEIRTYSAGVEISSGARQYFFPYKTIQFLQLERRTEGERKIWALHIRTDRDKINLTSARDLEADFRALMIAYRT
jgi:hypothetical protein